MYEALKRVLNALVTDLMNEVRARVAALGATTLDEIRLAPARLAALSPADGIGRAPLPRSFSTRTFTTRQGWKRHTRTRTKLVEGLFVALMAEPALLPADHQAQIPTEGLARTVADYIAGMTDSFIEQLWAALQRCAS